MDWSGAQTATTNLPNWGMMSNDDEEGWIIAILKWKPCTAPHAERSLQRRSHRTAARPTGANTMPSPLAALSTTHILVACIHFPPLGSPFARRGFQPATHHITLSSHSFSLVQNQRYTPIISYFANVRWRHYSRRALVSVFWMSIFTFNVRNEWG